jgi:hypothetical protein
MANSWAELLKIIRFWAVVYGGPLLKEDVGLRVWRIYRPIDRFYGVIYRLEKHLPICFVTYVSESRPRVYTFIVAQSTNFPCKSVVSRNSVGSLLANGNS